MKWWLALVALTVVCWGAYVPALHHGQQAFGDRNSALRAFLFVGVAYCVMAALVLGYVVVFKAEPLVFTAGGVSISTLAGVLGAVGALGVVFALKGGGRPLVVAPLVFAGAPLVNTIVSMLWSKPAKAPSVWFYVGIVVAACGAAMVLRFRPV